MSRKPITAADIAKIAGVSRSTVAGVVNDYSFIAESTKIKVRAIIDEYGYVPNSAARGLVGKKARIFGHFIFGDREKIKNAYFGELIVHIIESSQEAGYSVVTSTIRSGDIHSVRNLLQDGTIQGAIISGGTPDREEVEDLLRLKFPLVFVDKLPRDFNLEGTEDKYLICPDDYTGGFMATEYLISRGHREILHISGLKDRVASRSRREGFLRSLEKSGIEGGPHSILEGDFTSDTADRVFTEYLESRSPRPTAVFAASDVTALGVIRACRRKGLTIPGDLSLIGYDDLAISQDMQPPLTTMGVIKNSLAAKAVSLIVSAIEGQRESCSPVTVIKPVLIERNSVSNPS